jgi:hypothetical protein
VILINIWAFSCLYMGQFVPALNGLCSCPPMGRDLGPNPARYNGPARPDTKLFWIVCAWAVLFSVLRASPPDSAQMYTYTRAATFSYESPGPSFYRCKERAQVYNGGVAMC